MGVYGTSAVLAILFGIVLLFFLFVPYAAWTYRERGTLGFGHAILSGIAVVHFLAMWTYTILPLPDASTLRCTDGGAGFRLTPFASLAEIDLATNGWRDPMLFQLIANVLLFIPFGMLARHLFRVRRWWLVILAGLGISLLIETTQLTGIWGIYPCSYRYFEVDDLITNTLGTAIGVGLAPLLRLVPGQEALPTDKPRVVRRARRLLGMALDLAAVYTITILVYLPVALAAREQEWFGTREETPFNETWGWILLAVSLTLLLLLPLLRRGATPGQYITYVRPVPAASRAERTVRARGGPAGQVSTVPARSAVLLRWLTGSGGYFLLSAFGSITDQSGIDALSTVWVLVSGAVVLLRHPRGLSGYAAGLNVVDARDPRAEQSRAQEVDPRSLGMAVVTSVVALFIGFSILTTIGSLSPLVGAAFGVIGVAILAVGTLALVPFLVANGVVAMRREGPSIITILPMALAVGILGLLGLVILAMASGNGWFIVITTAVLAVAGYFGLLFGAFLGYGQWYARRDPTAISDAVVVLGSRVFDDRVPPLLAARLDRGMEILNQFHAADPNSRAVLVCSGGQGSDETMAEGAAMAKYVVERGIPEIRVRRETRSRNTEENLVFSRDLLREEGLGEPLIVVTNDFHAFRAAILTRELGISAQVIGAPTARYYFPSSLIREFVAVLSRSPVVHVVVSLALGALVGGIAALFVL